MADVSQIAANGIDYDCKDAAARADIATLQSGLQTANGNITSLQSDISEINGDISEINGDISEINGDISEINGDISALQTTVANIIESGAGYCKLSDGTLMQWGSLTVTNATFYAYGSLFQTTVSLTLPKSFVNANYVLSGSSKTISGAAEFGIGQGASSASTASIRVYDVSNRTADVSSSNPMAIRWMAIGRWK